MAGQFEVLRWFAGNPVRLYELIERLDPFQYAIEYDRRHVDVWPLAWAKYDRRVG